MDIVNKVIDELDLRKWIISSEEKDEIVDNERLLWRFECENEFWTWTLDFTECIDCEPGILGMKNLINKIYPIAFKEYLGDLLIQNTKLGTINNLMFLLKCKNVEQYFDLRFSRYEKLEVLLKKYYIVKVPICLRDVNFNLNNRYPYYQIELFDLQDEKKEIAVLIPLTGEFYKSFQDKEERKRRRDDGEYSLYIYRFNNRNFRRAVYYSFPYKDAPIWSHKNHSFFMEEDKYIVMQLLLIHRFHYSHIDKNIFLLLIKKLSFSESLSPLLSEIRKLL